MQSFTILNFHNFQLLLEMLSNEPPGHKEYEMHLRIMNAQGRLDWLPVCLIYCLRSPENPNLFGLKLRVNGIIQEKNVRFVAKNGESVPIDGELE